MTLTPVSAQATPPDQRVPENFAPPLVRLGGFFRPEQLAAMAISMLLIVASIKDDPEILVGVEVETFQYSTPVFFIKSHVIILYALLAGLGLYALKSMTRFGVNLGIPSLVFALIYLAAFARSLPVEPSFAFKMFAGFVMFMGVMFFVGMVFLNYREHAVFVIERAFVYFGMMIITLNVYEYYAGGSFSYGQGRFFGTSAHPNFIGVQLCIACIAQICLIRSPGLLMKGVGIGFLMAGMFLLYSTGSRTAILVFVAGMLCYVLLAPKNSVLAFLFVFFTSIMLALMFAYAASGALYFDMPTMYDRGNTRAEAWDHLWGYVLEDPLFGRGKFIGYSENSLLRGWAAIGLMYPFGFCLSVFLFFLKVRPHQRQNGMRTKHRVLLSILLAITVGSVFEGYLVDTLSCPLLTWLITMSALSVSVKRPQQIQEPAGRGS